MTQLRLALASYDATGVGITMPMGSVSVPHDNYSIINAITVFLR